MIMRINGLLTVICTGAALACGESGPAATLTPTPTTIRVEVEGVELRPGQTRQLTAEVLDQTGAVMQDATVTWRSEDAGVAAVSPDGEVRAVAEGATDVIAESGSLRESVAVLVSEEAIATAIAEECAVTDPAWIWCDDFESDRLSSYFEVDGADGDFSRAGGVGVVGSTGMRARFDTGETGAGSLKLAFGRTPQSYFDAVDGGDTDYREIFWRVYVRHQVGWTGGGGDKLSRATIFASPGSWAQAMIAHVWSGQGSTRDHLILDPASGTDETGLLQTTTYNDFAHLRWLGADQSETPLFDSGHVGDWYCIEARVRLNDAGQSNGVFQLWIDEVLEAERTSLNWVGSYDDYGINAVFLENYWNDGSVASQERYFDNFVVSTERIGCGA